jgi:hypothetical protein
LLWAPSSLGRLDASRPLNAQINKAPHAIQDKTAGMLAMKIFLKSFRLKNSAAILGENAPIKNRMANKILGTRPMAVIFEDIEARNSSNF